MKVKCFFDVDESGSENAKSLKISKMESFRTVFIGGRNIEISVLSQEENTFKESRAKSCKKT